MLCSTRMSLEPLIWYMLCPTHIRQLANTNEPTSKINERKSLQIKINLNFTVTYHQQPIQVEIQSRCETNLSQNERTRDSRKSGWGLEFQIHTALSSILCQGLHCLFLLSTANTNMSASYH